MYTLVYNTLVYTYIYSNYIYIYTERERRLIKKEGTWKDNIQGLREGPARREIEESDRMFVCVRVRIMIARTREIGT